MRHLLIIIASICLFTFGATNCTNSSAFNKSSGDIPDIHSSDHLTMAVLYHQTAAEYRALCYQAFNTAKIQVNNHLKLMGMSKPYAIVVDIDETVLDNSPHQAKCIQNNSSYPNYWEEWMNVSNAHPIPGALDFLRYVNTRKIEIFYVSNRSDEHKSQTLRNLKKLDFPNSDTEHLLLKTNISSKKERWDEISKKFKIILFVGDNLNDFSETFEKKSIHERFQQTDNIKNDFGSRFIVLPNAMYGEWEGALYNYDYSKSQDEKKDLMYRQLKGF